MFQVYLLNAITIPFLMRHHEIKAMIRLYHVIRNMERTVIIVSVGVFGIV